MLEKHRVLVLLAALLLPGVLMSTEAGAQRANNRTTGTAPAAEEPLVPQAPVGHRQPRAKDLPPPQQTAEEREQARKDRELDKRLRICRNC
jgi:hypothetical protein